MDMKRTRSILMMLAIMIPLAVSGQARFRNNIDARFLERIQDELVGAGGQYIDNNLSHLLKFASKAGLSYVGKSDGSLVMSNCEEVLTADTVPTNTSSMFLTPIDGESSIKLVTVSSYMASELSLLLDELDRIDGYRYIQSKPADDHITHTFEHNHSGVPLHIEIEAYRSGFWLVAMYVLI